MTDGNKIQQLLDTITDLSDQVKQQFEEIKEKSDQIKAKSEEITDISDTEERRSKSEEITNISKEITDICEGITSLSDKDPSQIELYKIYRDYIKHEDSLINNRLTWLLLAEGFFFTSYCSIVSSSPSSSTCGFTDYKTILCILTSSHSSSICQLQLILIFTGILVGVFGSVGIVASSRSIDSFKSFGQQKLTNTRDLGLPDLTGGFDGLAKKIGLTPRLTIPPLIICIWVYVLSQDWCFALSSFIIFVVLIVIFGRCQSRN
ncbi:MAG: hypothetical protein AB4060_08465 [Crocosphaera sp.]